MWSFLIVVSTPILQLFVGIRKAQEPVGVQAFGPKSTIECFDERVVGRLARPREVQRHTLLVGPEIHVPGNELRALVDTDSLRIADATAYPIQGRHHIFPAVAEPDRTSVV